MEFKMITRATNDFEDICIQCEDGIVQENLRKNGGTLNLCNLTYGSDFLILCLEDNVPIGFCSLVLLDTVGLYVYQIAVKKEYQKKGIGSNLIKVTKELAFNLGINISAHVKAYNTNSQKMFLRSDFIKNDDYSNTDEYFYEYKVLIKNNVEEEKGLK